MASAGDGNIAGGKTGLVALLGAERDGGGGVVPERTPAKERVAGLGLSSAKAGGMLSVSVVCVERPHASPGGSGLCAGISFAQRRLGFSFCFLFGRSKGLATGAPRVDVVCLLFGLFVFCCLVGADLALSAHDVGGGADAVRSRGARGQWWV